MLIKGMTFIGIQEKAAQAPRNLQPVSSVEEVLKLVIRLVIS